MNQKQENLFQALSQMIKGGADPVSHEDDLWRRFGETVAVLVMDTSGFSRTCASHGLVHFLTRLMQLRSISAPLFDAHGCRRLRFEADNAFAAFATVDEALCAAEGVHAAIRDAGLMLTRDEPMTVSIGIGYGELLYSETLEGYFGDEMNFASKLGEDLGSGRETRITQSAFRMASTGLREGFRTDKARISGIEIAHYVRTAACG